MGDGDPKYDDGPACECADAKCPVHEGQSACVSAATALLTRVDMERWAGDSAAQVHMCDPCAEDALDSDVFAMVDDLDEEEEE